MTFRDIYTQWLDEKRAVLKPASLSTYALIVENYVLPVLGEKEGLSQEDVDGLRQAVLELGKSEKTALDSATVAKSIANYAAKKGWWPLVDLSLEQHPSIEKKEFKPLTAAQQRKIIAFTDISRTARNVGLYIATTAGLTIGELCNLYWEDIDIDHKFLHVKGSVLRCYRDDPETGERVWTVSRVCESEFRSIPLTAKQVAYLQEEKAKHLPEMFVLTGHDKPMDLRAVNHYAAAVFNDLGMKGHQFKDLRHSFALRALESGLNYNTVGELLGVSSLQTLAKLYGPYIKQPARKAMEQVMKAME